MTKSIALEDKFASFSEHWRPKTLAECNGQEVRIAKTQGVFPWHSHADADELFLCWRGEFQVEMRSHIVTLRPGELVVDVCAASELDAEEVLAHGSFSWHVLTSLTDDVQVFNDGIELGGAGPVVGISLTSRRAISAR